MVFVVVVVVVVVVVLVMVLVVLLLLLVWFFWLWWMVVEMVLEEELPLTTTLSPEYVSELTPPRFPCVFRLNWGMNREVRVVSRSVIRSILDRLWSSMLVWSSWVCCCGWAALTAPLPPLTSARSGRLPFSKK